MENKVLIEKLLSAQKIAMFTHQNPDADGIGSMICLCIALKNSGKSVDMFCDSEIPTRYSFFYGVENINSKEFDSNAYDLLVCVDCAELKRLGKYGDVYKAFDNTINIDHHKTNNNFGKNNCVKVDYKSCGEIIFEILEQLNFSYTKEMATALYASIASDTGRFNYDGVNQLTFYKASKLLEYGADLHTVHQKLFNSRTKEQFALGQVMLKNLSIIDNFVVTYTMLEDFEKTNSQRSDTELFYNWITGIEGTRAVVILKQEKEEEFHISLRGNGDIDVGLVATKFGGGGHRDAAGCTIFAPLKEAIDMLVQEMKRN